MNKAIKVKISLVIICVINFLFLFKYLVRISIYALPIAIIYSLTICIVYYALLNYQSKFLNKSIIYWILVLVYTLVFIILFKHIHVEQLNVDRWSVIESFWQNALHGKYPYSARSHMGNYPGPMPVYFIIALPFYLIHETGYLSLLGVILFVSFLRQFETKKENLIVLILTILLIPLFWEITTRSTIFINAVLFLLYLHFITSKDITKLKYFYISSIIGGLLLSTRLIFAIPLIIFCIFMLKNRLISFKSIIIWTIILLITFALTFIPFLIYNFNEFLKINPFIVQ